MKRDLVLSLLLGKTLALASGVGKGPKETHAYPVNDDYFESKPWALLSGRTTVGYHFTGFCDDSSCPTNEWRIKAGTDMVAATDNKIGARGRGYDRCSTSESWVLLQDTNWSYAYAGVYSVQTPHAYAGYRSCGPGQQHQYRNRSDHLFTNNSPYLNSTKTYTTVL